jgi:hypothetical protein
MNLITIGVGETLFREKGGVTKRNGPDLAKTNACNALT